VNNQHGLINRKTIQKDMAEITITGIYRRGTITFDQELPFDEIAFIECGNKVRLLPVE